MAKKESMTREEAAELYRDLQKTMKDMKQGSRGAASKGSTSQSSVAKEIAAAIKQGIAKDIQQEQAESGTPKMSFDSMKLPPMSRMSLPRGSGQVMALSLVVAIASVKLMFTALEVSGVMDVAPAQASMAKPFQTASMIGPKYTKEEVRILTALDARRQKLDERGKKLDLREDELNQRDREYASHQTTLRELVERLKTARTQKEQKRDGQLEQLASVYGSMNPAESAELIEQLDVSIALSLLERMPEKRIGQILSLMSPDRALTITRMLSGGGK